MITRRFYFCASHRYYLSYLNFEENLKLFKKTVFEHGHNYNVFISIKGQMDYQTGMVINISKIKQIVNEVIENYYDHKNLNLDNPFFKDKLPTTENISISFWHFLKDKLNLYQVKVYENEELFSIYKGGENVILGRIYRFSAGHKLYNKELSKEENFRLYGKCSNENGHGHEYKLEVWIEGEVNSETGFVMNLEELDSIVKSVLDEIDHKFLNYDVEFFKENLPTTENLLIYFKMKLKPLLKNLKKLIIYETENNIFEIECE